MSGGDPALVKQCLDVCQALAIMGKTNFFSRILGSTFIFNLDTRSKAASPVGEIPKKKKPSPSTLRRNLRRKEEFLKQKRETSKDMETSCLADGTFQCEHCDNKFKTENGLKIHIGKSHKDLKEILSPEKVCNNSMETSLTASTLRDTVREEKEIEEVEEVSPLPVYESVQMVKEYLEPYELEFNKCNKWSTSTREIPKSDLKVHLPKPPPKKVKHEVLGIGEFVKTNYFGDEGPTSHQHIFKRKDKNGKEAVTFLYVLDPEFSLTVYCP